MEPVPYATVELSLQRKILGRGSFGTTYLQILKTTDGTKKRVAVKRMTLSDDYTQAAFQAEVEFAKYASEKEFGPRFYGAYVEKSSDDDTPGEAVLVTELLKPFYEARVDASLVNKVFEVVQRMHACNVLHADLYDSNVMLTGAGEPRLIDFGASWLIENGKFTSEIQALDYVTLFYGKHAADEDFGEGRLFYEKPEETLAKERVLREVGEDALLSAIRKRFSVTGTLDDPTGMTYNDLHISNSVFVDVHGMFKLLCESVHPEFFQSIGASALAPRLFFASNNNAPPSAYDKRRCENGKVVMVEKEVYRLVMNMFKRRLEGMPG